MISNIYKGLIIGLFLLICVYLLWFLPQTGHIKYLRVKKCEAAAGLSLKALNERVKSSWFQRKHNDVQVLSDGPCMFLMFYQKPGALYFGEEMTSGHLIGVAMTTTELNEFADTISLSTDFQQMLYYLSMRAKEEPAPTHEF